MENLTQNNTNCQAPATVAHHKLLSSPIILKDKFNKYVPSEIPYNVQATFRIIPKAVFIKRHDAILNFIRQLGFTKKESWAIIRLLRFWIYYGLAYPKAETVCGGEKLLNKETNKIETRYADFSVRTFWYAVKKLDDAGLLVKYRQLLNGRKTASLYRLDKLVLYLAARMAEHAQLRLNRIHSGLLTWFKSIWHDRDQYEVNLALEEPITRLMPI